MSDRVSSAAYGGEQLLRMPVPVVGVAALTLLMPVTGAIGDGEGDDPPIRGGPVALTARRPGSASSGVREPCDQPGTTGTRQRTEAPPRQL
ncbi:hypothetical protein, partial [Streptomyces europaeiscabiei]|uniref:hypothetical protein n=1 Tax=Streptomyces europaeiscabiei TaxID=146819 RepID=UPI001C1E1AA8